MFRVFTDHKRSLYFQKRVSVQRRRGSASRKGLHPGGGRLSPGGLHLEGDLPQWGSAKPPVLTFTGSHCSGRHA